MNTACFTGHRKIDGQYDPGPSYADNVKPWSKIHTALRNIVKQLYEEHGITKFISGGAIGVDQVAASAVLTLRGEGLPLHLEIARPFPSQASKWIAKTQARFDNMCSLADSLIDVSPDPYTPQKMQIRNQYMVDSSSIVVAVWNGSSGGTGNCVNYAQSIERTILHVYPDTLEMKWMNKQCPATTSITSFDNDNRFLSNFHLSVIKYDGVAYPSSENFYQAMKSTNKDDHVKIASLTAGQAKREGKKLTMREDWEDVKDEIMLWGLREKFNNPNLQKMLLNTNEVELVEGNKWHDNYWGSCTCDKCDNKGQNKLGKMLMSIRQEIAEQKNS